LNRARAACRGKCRSDASGRDFIFHYQRTAPEMRAAAMKKTRQVGANS
jgi:hypothetical protein